ncbi:hypothetical protein EWM64_g7687, partial [Hericium alpestre]
LVVDQYVRVWDEIASKRLRVDAPRAGALIAQNLGALRGIDEGLFDAAWGAFAPGVRTSIEKPGDGDRQGVLALLKALYDTGEAGGPVRVAAAAMVNEIARAAVSASQDALAGEDDARVRQSVSLLAGVVDAFGAVLFEDANLASALDNLVVQQSSNLLRISPTILTTYLSRRGDDERVLSLWRTVLSEVSAHSETLYLTLPALLDAASRNILPEHLTPAGQELDPTISKLFADATEAQTSKAQELLLRVVQSSKFFITYESLETLLQLVISDFTDTFTAVFHGQQVDASKLVLPLELVTACFESHPHLASNTALTSSLMPLVYLLTELLPSSVDLEDTHLISLAQSLAASWWAKAPEDARLAVRKSIKNHLREAIGDVGVLSGSDDIVQLATTSKPLLTVSELLSDVVPSRQALESSFLELRSDPSHPSLAITLPLIPPAESFDVATETDGEFDRLGLSSYARIVLALLYTFMDDRQAAKQNLWAFKHLIALSLYAEEFLQVPALPSLVFAPFVSRDLLRETIVKVQQLSTYMLMAPAESGWHARVVKAAMGEKVSEPLDDVAVFISEFVKSSQDEDTYIESRILHTVLQHILGDTDKDEGDQWMLLARKIEKQAPQLSLAIVLAVTQFGPEPPRLERYRNELAAGALGIRASKANTEGLLLLHRLIASAPDPDSDIVFLPQPRAVNFLKACQQWIGSDEELDEDLESEMTFAFFHLVPILQNVPGAHWDLIFDVIENNLENSSFEDDETLTILWRTVKLVQVIQDLVTYNKPLRASWKERETNILTLLRDLIAAKPGSVSDSKPRSVCREAALSIVQNLPASLVDHETLSKMSHLLSDPSIDVQKMAYDLLREAANKRTEHVVIEAAVETESPMKPELPIELVQLLQQSIDWVYEGDYRPAFGYLLSWMVTFDLFANTSLKVRSGYTEHLRDLGLISSHFVPTILTLLDLYSGPSKAFKLDGWAVDEFYIHSYEPEEDFSRKVFAAHVYYRALNTIPSLVRTWLLDCKDRTLLTTVTNYTAQHFSPVIIGRELANVKSPEAAEELNVENLTVKVASRLNEVTAVYTVDEQNLELTLKIPADWPLHGIEVKDSKRVGVTENRWRGWLLGVQQIVWSQNGHIVDALILFKKNVTLHFEGQVECAICYSNKRKVVVTRDLGLDVMPMLYERKDLDVVVWKHDSQCNQNWLLDNVPGAAGLLVMLNDKIDDEVLDKAGSSLRVVSTYSVGYEHVDVDSISKREIRLGYTPDVLTDAVADLTVMLALTATRNSGDSASVLVKQGKWPSHAWSPFGFCGPQISTTHFAPTRTIGFFGFGRISQAVLKRLVAFGITDCIYVTKPGSPTDTALETSLKEQYKLRSVRRVRLDVLAKESDVVFLLAPGGNQTWHAIDEDFLKEMKETAVLINTSRGTLVNSDALAKALKQGWLWGAGLDVVEGEPNIGTDHPLVKAPRCVIVPHIGSATFETRVSMGRLAVHNLLAGLEGVPMPSELKINGPA